MEALSLIQWKDFFQRCAEFSLLIVAIFHALIVRLWANRGRLAPTLRKMAKILNSLASSLPEPLSAESPRSALIAALIDAGQSPATLSKANQTTLISKARRLSLIP